MKLITLLAGLSMVAMTAQGATKKNYCGTNEVNGKFKNGTTLAKCTNIPANRRSLLGGKVKGGTPVAVAKDKNNNLYVMYATGYGLAKCGVASGVIGNAKVSSSTYDTAIAYFKGSNKSLWELQVKESTIKGKGQCPKSAKYDMKESYNKGVNPSKRLGPEVEKFKLVPDSTKKIIGAALFKGGRVLKWSNNTMYLNKKGGKKGYGQIK